MLAARPDEASRARARQALEALCRAYWVPLYAFVRYRGHTRHDAEDLTQAFFTAILGKGGFPSVDPARGRFRSYLLGAMKHFLSNERDRARSLRRGGGVQFVDLEALDREPPVCDDDADPDAEFDREWAHRTAARALDRLRDESEARGRGDLFEALSGSLTGEDPPRGETAKRLGMTEGAVKVAVHRLRRRYREILRSEIAETVDDPREVDDEMRHLVAALRRNL